MCRLHRRGRRSGLCGGCAVRMTCCFFFFQAEDGIRDVAVTGVQTCALPISAVVSGGERAMDGAAWDVRAMHRRFAAIVGEEHCIVDEAQLRTYECDGLTTLRDRKSVV